MKKPMKLLLIASLITGPTIAGLAYAMPGGGDCERSGHHRGMGSGGEGMDIDKRIARMADKLDLNPEQRTRIGAIVDKSRPSLQQLGARLRDNHQQLHALQQQDKASEEEVRRLADIQGRDMAEMIVLRSRLHSEIRALLTPEQRLKSQELHKRHGGSQDKERHSDAGAYGQRESELGKRVSM